ncbi:helix-turn-helix domain-containing protein [Castellaniella sp.]|uniref:transcriptional regulator n=1 Tax=Castellaniella sp. TaxID=1955812 RepID=UPI002AFFD95F|nr:helix-turn-helix domain-containing protein [Castellaniella sp.]
MSTQALHRACTIVGSQSALADKIGVRQSTLWHWLNRAKRGAPAEYVAAIETATDGAISRHELRPDIYGPAPEQRRAS